MLFFEGAAILPVVRAVPDFVKFHPRLVFHMPGFECQLVVASAVSGGAHGRLLSAQ